MKRVQLAVAIASGLLLTSLAQAIPITFRSNLSGPAEAPPNASPATGFASVTIDTDANTLVIDAIWSGLLGLTTVAHIHCCTAVPGAGTVGVAVTPGTLPDFPAGVTSGTYHRELNTEDISIYTATFFNNFGGGTAQGAEAALLAGLQAGKAYFNIHSNLFPSGEIRGFLVPEPASLALMGLGLLGLGLTRRKHA